MAFGMYIYDYSPQADIPEIVDNVSKKPQKSVILIKANHFSEEDAFPLDLAKEIVKETNRDIRVGYEILPNSVNTSTSQGKEEFEKFVDYLNKHFCYGSGSFRKVLEMPDNVKVHGLRPLPYEKSRGLIEDFNSCIKHYNSLYKEHPNYEIKIDDLYVDGVDLDRTYAKEISKNKINIPVFGEIHIERVKQRCKPKIKMRLMYLYHKIMQKQHLIQEIFN